jgi:hypothetical protein
MLLGTPCRPHREGLSSSLQRNTCSMIVAERGQIEASDETGVQGRHRSDSVVTVQP